MHKGSKGYGRDGGYKTVGEKVTLYLYDLQEEEGDHIRTAGSDDTFRLVSVQNRAKM